MLCTLRPRFLPASGPVASDIIYADAYFPEGDKQKSAHQHPDATDDQRLTVDKQPNGWGAVFLPKSSQQGIAIRGCVPDSILKPFTCNKAYIYFLKAFAQVAAKFFFAPIADEWTIHFIDNDSAKHAINKGYCRTRAMCNMLGTFWTTCARTGNAAWMERVSSEANPSDEISRDVWSIVLAQGWVIMSINIIPLIPIFEQMAVDATYAHQGAGVEILRIIGQQSIPQFCKHDIRLLRLQSRSTCICCAKDCPPSCGTCKWRCCSECPVTLQKCRCT